MTITIIIACLLVIAVGTLTRLYQARLHTQELRQTFDRFSANANDVRHELQQTRRELHQLQVALQQVV